MQEAERIHGKVPLEGMRDKRVWRRGLSMCAGVVRESHENAG